MSDYHNIKRLKSQLAKLLAKTEVEVREKMYKEEAEMYAEEGVTLSSHMSINYADENLETFIREVIAEELIDIAQFEYWRIVREKYNNKER